MSRHRIIRSMNYDDERYIDDGDDYGHSYDDKFSVSPSTAEQFMYKRDQSSNLSSCMNDELPDELSMGEELYGFHIDGMRESAVSSSSTSVDADRLQWCRDELQDVMGDAVEESILTETIVRHNYKLDLILNELLNDGEEMKPPRTKNLKMDPKQASATAEMEELSPNTRHQPMTPDRRNVPPAGDSPASVTMATSSRTVDSGSCLVSGQAKSVDRDEDGGATGLHSGMTRLTLSTGADFGQHCQSSSLCGSRGNACSDPSPLPRSTSKTKNDKIDARAEYMRIHGEKEPINLVVIGHVDAGKSTLMGHLLYRLGNVQQRIMHKFEQESRKMGKSSFAYAWILDETEEERSRGVTVDIGQTHFVTAKKMVTLLDAPGHKDFIPNMITGACQADVAILVVNAARGEFETGFESGGQTREHAMLARSLGVSQIIVVVNKMDTVDWAESRYVEIVHMLRKFLRQVGFKDDDLSFIPCSGLAGENLTASPGDRDLVSWYSGPTLLTQIDLFRSIERPVDKLFRLVVSDVLKVSSAGACVAGRLSSGHVRPGDKLLVMPAAVRVAVKSLTLDDEPSQLAFAGDNVTLSLIGSGVDTSSINAGSILCPLSAPGRCADRVHAKIVLFDLPVPMTKGFPVSFHYLCMSEPAVVTRLLATVNRSTGQVVKTRPKCLTKNSSATVEIRFERSLCLELFSEFRDLGRFMLRDRGRTIAAGVIEEILD